MATAAAPAQTTALARFEDVRAAMAEYTPDRYISLIPTVDMERSPLFRPATMVVPIDPADVRDVYKSPANDGTVCLRARKLEQIGSAIGVKWLDVKIDHNKERATVTATVHAEYTDAVGDRIPLVAAATEYLTPAKGRSVSTYPDEKAQARARAILVKKLTGLPTSFDPKELAAKQFAGLRWVLDDRQPDIRDAIINRGTRAAAQVFGMDAPQKAIDAGHEGPDDDVIEGQARVVEDAKAEPEIPDAEPATPPALDVAALRSKLEGVRAKLRAADGPANGDLILSIGVTMRDVLQLRDRVAKDRWSDVRLAILAALWGVGSTNDLTAKQASTTLTWLADDEGKSQARALFEHLLRTDAAFAERVGAQGTLLDAAQKL